MPGTLNGVSTRSPFSTFQRDGFMNFLRTPGGGFRLRSALVTLALTALPTLAAAQSGSVTGRVTGDASQPLAGARVFLVGTTQIATTNSDGRYTIRVAQSGAAEIRVLHVGFAEQKKSVMIAAGSGATLDFTMTPIIVKLQDVVTTATGEVRKVELGNAISTLGDVGKRVEETATTNMGDLLVAKAPGVIVLPGTMTGTAGTIRIRGLNSLSLTNAPIWVVDGVRFT